MKTYIITEKDIERLKDLLIVEDLLVDKWVETLSYKTNEPYEDLQREIDKLKKMLDDNI